VNPVLRALLVTAGILTLALCWFGWRLFTQERAVARERQRERLESSLEAMAAGVRGQWAQAGESLSRWISSENASPPSISGAVVFAVAANHAAVTPEGGLPFVPPVVSLARAGSITPEVFAEAEAAEFGGSDPARAVRIYRDLAGHADPRMRAEALLRLGRVLLKSGDRAGARLAYAALVRLEGVTVAGLPAALVGLDGQRKAGEPGIEKRIAAGLRSGKWLLTRGQAEYYSEIAGLPADPEQWVLAEAMTTLWERRAGPAIDVQGRILLGLWRGNQQRWAGLVADPARLLDIKAPPWAPVPVGGCPRPSSGRERRARAAGCIAGAG
jgi:hypothetical protein